MKKQPLQETLFPEISEQETTEARKYVYVYLPKTLGKYDRYEVTSAFRKSIKLGLIEDSFYWLTTLLKYGNRGARGYILRQCWIVCNEDIFDQSIVAYCSSMVLMEKEFYIRETDSFYQLVWRMCKAAKWWEVEGGREWDESWAKSEGQVKMESKDIPDYALDTHTLIGKEMQNSGCSIPDQFSGTEIGRQKTRYIFERDCGLNKDADIDEGFWDFWKRYQKTLNGE